MNKHRSIRVAALGFLALAVSVGAVHAQGSAVTGTVTYRQRSALPPTARVMVQLADVSLADAPAQIISEQTIPTEGKQVPFPYRLEYDPAKIIESHTYAVQARIMDGDKLLFINDTAYLVITRGNPTENVEVVVVPVGATAPETPPATLPTTGGAGLPWIALLAAGVLLVAAGLGLRRMTA